MGLTSWVPAHVDNKRKCAEENKQNYVDFYKDAERIFARWPELQKEPGRIVNIDESPLEGRNSKQLGRRRKLVSKTFKVQQRIRCMLNPSATYLPRATTPNDTGGGHISFLGAICADGQHHPPPGFLFSGKHLQASWFEDDALPAPIKELMRSAFIRCTGKGSMTQETFELYILKHIVAHQRKRFPTGPLLILLDGPDTHAMTETLAEELLKLDDPVILAYFPHNMTCKLQPLDRGVFKYLKKWYREAKRMQLQHEPCSVSQSVGISGRLQAACP